MRIARIRTPSTFIRMQHPETHRVYVLDRIMPDITRFGPDLTSAWTVRRERRSGILRCVCWSYFVSHSPVRSVRTFFATPRNRLRARTRASGEPDARIRLSSAHLLRALEHERRLATARMNRLRLIAIAAYVLVQLWF